MFTSCVLVSPCFTVFHRRLRCSCGPFLPTGTVLVNAIVVALVTSPSSDWWLSQPLWKMMEFISWDDYFQYMEQKLQMFQTTNQIIYWYSHIIPYTYIIHILYIYYTYIIHILYIYYTYIIHIYIYILYIYYTYIIHILYTYCIIYILYIYYTYIPYYTIIIWQCPKILLFLIIVLFPPALSIQKTFA